MLVTNTLAPACFACPVAFSLQCWRPSSMVWGRLEPGHGGDCMNHSSEPHPLTDLLRPFLFFLAYDPVYEALPSPLRHRSCLTVLVRDCGSIERLRSQLVIILLTKARPPGTSAAMLQHFPLFLLTRLIIPAPTVHPSFLCPDYCRLGHSGPPHHFVG